MKTQLTYTLVLAGSVAGPLALSFDRKVSYYRKWKNVFLASLVPALLFILWDIRFAATGVWSFSPEHVIGISLWGLPLEEILFFVLVPFCCLFIYYCVKAYFPALHFQRQAGIIMRILAFALLVLAVFNMSRDYTSWTSILLALYIGLVYTKPDWFPGFRADYFLASYVLILIPFLIVNGVLTAIPVVSYNDFENLGLRIYTIPVEDVFYGMLLILMNVTLLERKVLPAS